MESCSIISFSPPRHRTALLEAALARERRRLVPFLSVNARIRHPPIPERSVAVAEAGAGAELGLVLQDHVSLQLLRAAFFLLQGLSMGI